MGRRRGSGIVRVVRHKGSKIPYYVISTTVNSTKKILSFPYTAEGLELANMALEEYKRCITGKDKKDFIYDPKYKTKKITEGIIKDSEKVYSNINVYYNKVMKRCYIRTDKKETIVNGNISLPYKAIKVTIFDGDFEEAFSEAINNYCELYPLNIREPETVKKITSTKLFVFSVYKALIKKYDITTDYKALNSSFKIYENSENIIPTPSSSSARVETNHSADWVTEEQNVLQCSFKKMLEPTDNFKPKEIDSSLDFYDLIKENLIIMSAGVNRKIFHKKIENFFDNLLKLDKVFSKQPDLIFTRNYPGWKITKERKCTLLIDGNGKLFINDISVGKVNFNEKQFNNYNIVSYGTEIIEKVLEKDISDTINKITEQFEEIFIREPFSVDIGILEFMKENKSKFYNGAAVDCIKDIKIVRSTSTELNVNYTKVHLCLKTTFGNIIIT